MAKSQRAHRLVPRRRRALFTAVGLLTVAGSVTVPLVAQATGGTDPADTARQRAFAAAAGEFHVPREVLLALAYQESAWDNHAGWQSAEGGYGPMHLTDVTATTVADGGADAAGPADVAKLAAPPALHTLRVAAKLTGLSLEMLRTNDAANIRGGAALLASYQEKLHSRASAEPADWYGAVARYSQASREQGARAFANRVFATVKNGASRTTPDGQRVSLAATPEIAPATDQLAELDLPMEKTAATECPDTVDCTFVPADPSTGQTSDRPANHIRIDTIVIHDTELSYKSAITTFQQPGTSASHYVMRSSDGAVSQMVRTKDIAFHTGNYSSNLHSIGIEHEGYAAHGANWYTEAQYEATADLVKYLAHRFQVPLDRQHIIGHDNVPGPSSTLISAMHWDPGPSWDWDHFMALLGKGGKERRGVGGAGSVVTIAPGFAYNEQTLQICPSDDPTGAVTACTDVNQPSDFVYLRTLPSKTAPLFGDWALHSGAKGTDRISDWGSTAQAGQQFVVAGTQGAWTAIWFSGSKVWFYNPHGVNTTRANGVTAVSSGATSDSKPVAVYGSGYPDASEYTTAGLKSSPQVPLSMYSIPAGQAYVATAAPAATDDYFASSGKAFIGGRTMYTIQYNHRTALVYSTDVSAEQLGGGRH
ncbi:N-acetylmuramoyl-L-alanine amidase [Streptomyces sp. NPDC087843]|uniref:N-acetylmuramoyl-L-alanine amidase n=1 Tax=Streptomyces sp. NPDC087843 TaxID=3365804 RepID=UPI00380AC859